MLIHEEKRMDMENRLLMLEAIEIALRNGLMRDAKTIGESCKKMADKIKNKNYTSPKYPWMTL